MEEEKIKMQTNSKEFKSKGKLLRNASYFIIVMMVIVYALATTFAVQGIIGVMTPDRHATLEGLGEIVAIIAAIAIFYIYIPSLISAICGLRYYAGKSQGKVAACFGWGIISLLINCSTIYFITSRISIYDSFFIGNVNIRAQTAFAVISSIITCLPIILYLLGCCQEKFGKNINNCNKFSRVDR